MLASLSFNPQVCTAGGDARAAVLQYAAIGLCRAAALGPGSSLPSMPMCQLVPLPQDCATILGVVDLRLGYPPHKWRNVYKASAAAWIRLGGAERGWGATRVSNAAGQHAP